MAMQTLTSFGRDGLGPVVKGRLTARRLLVIMQNSTPIVDEDTHGKGCECITFLSGAYSSNYDIGRFMLSSGT